ncbi:MAG: SDR family NAD(P)-dependent oxidoreductase [Verrucomicrobia bacterium]|nr:SDR family NAD(P)-dependent oxidoreductase [Verrucomicrobiota bacterium]
MNLTNNTVLITGGGSGIGKGLAEAFHLLGNKVIIAGRRKHVLDKTTSSNPGMVSMELDVEKPEAIQAFARQVIKDHPDLNVLINNAGIARIENLKSPLGSLADSEATIKTNFLGPIRLLAALLPHLQKQSGSVIMNVSSGLAFVPMAMTPTYCATKAAIHSYTQSLRYQLRDSSVQIIELIPPYVQTELTGERQAKDPHAMPLDQFVDETMNILRNSPNATEICVERVKAMRSAERSGSYDAFFKEFNDSVTAEATQTGTAGT